MKKCLFWLELATLILELGIQVECLYISLLDQIGTHDQHRYLQGNLEMWFKDHYRVVTNPTVESCHNPLFSGYYPNGRKRLSQNPDRISIYSSWLFYLRIYFIIVTLCKPELFLHITRFLFNTIIVVQLFYT